MLISHSLVFFFFNDTATTEIYTLSLHDALPIWLGGGGRLFTVGAAIGVPILIACTASQAVVGAYLDRKSTRLNSSHANISYAVFCLKKKKKIYNSSYLTDNDRL